jgi:radical SAM protein with 4Fe4S-binding SPASM domain
MVDLTHGIQTNLLLFNSEFVPAFRRLKMKLSTSTDPLRGVRLVDGADYLDLWLEKLQEALGFGFHAGVICVIHKRHLSCLSEVLQYFENLSAFTDARIRLRFNTLYRAGKACDRALYDDLGITPEECGEVLVRLWEWWDRGGRLLSHAPPMSEWAHMFEQADGGKSCSHCENCATGWLGIDGRGDVYNCGRHMDSGHSFGNIHDAPLSEIVLNPERLRMFRRADLLKEGECRDCPIWDKCYGGCPDDAFLYSGDRMRKSHWCESYRLFHRKVFMKND